MRLWSLHPSLLDTKGLVALWREALLAKKVLEDKTKGYKNHPQLSRFRKYKYPLIAINSYLTSVYIEATERGYNFNNDKIKIYRWKTIIKVTFSQIEYELKHLLKKLKLRDPDKYNILLKINPAKIKPNPLFRKVKGDIEPWEKVNK
jgi:hypothetical protein